jgi:S-DNA-T family DNA segregation ATPase FtsK/SpoIIIE
MAEKDDIIVRKKIFSSKKKSKIEEEEEEEEGLDEEVNEDNEEYSKYFKAGAILLFTIAILIFLSLVSYTDKDEMNAISSVGQISEIVSGDESLKLKTETTHNLLGLLGAKLAFHLYNSTVGYIIFFLPYFLILFSKDLFKYLEIKTHNWKRLGIYILVCLLFSSLMGSINISEVFGNISKEWYGNIGYFISGYSVEYIGTVGSILLFLSAIIVTVVLGTSIQIDPILNYFVKTAEDSSSSLKDIIISSGKDLKEKLDSKIDDFKEKKESKSELEKISIEKVKKEKLSIRKPKTLVEDDDSIQNKNKLSKELDNIDVKYEIKKSEFEDEKKKAFELILGDSKSGKSRFGDEDDDLITNQEDEDNDLKIEQVDEDNTDNYEDDNNEYNKNTYSEANSVFSNEINSLLADIIEEDEDSFEQEIDDNSESKRLVLDVEIHDHSDDELDNPLSVLIHDEKINYTSPGLDLLNNQKFEESVDEEELKMNAKILQEKLETFKIFIENLQITPGPVVTQYAFTPAAGIKISRIESLQDDLAMALKAKGIRIIAPIPGKGSVGIEIPNHNPSLVTFSSVINSKKFYDNNMHLPIALGKNISGEVVIGDLAKMPHLLIAGTTGSGKSVGVNTIINSLLYKKSPSELKFAIIDPKKVELPQYSALKNHFLAISPDIKTPIVTDPAEAIVLLKSAVVEMEQRYDILASAGQRNIADYNAKVRAGKYKDAEDFDHRELPYIVVIVDEFADLILTAGKDVEEPIVRLAQMARAVGIHMIIATQRPSVDVITGIIKANFPSRIAFQVSSKVDSRTILDTSGAETLLGNGDMLYLPSGKPKPERVQNAYISTDEVENICDFIGNQKGYSKPYYFPSIQEESETGNISKEDRDPLFEEAARLIINTKQGSVSMLQRRLKIGYARAGRIVDELADAGVVGPFDGSKARLVLMESESDLEAIL